jgi:hypothetical protein
MNMHWIAMKEVRRVPKPERRESLMTALREIGPQRREMLL